MYSLANGREIRMDITVAEIDLTREIVGGTIVFGKADAETGARRSPP